MAECLVVRLHGWNQFLQEHPSTGSMKHNPGAPGIGSCGVVIAITDDQESGFDVDAGTKSVLDAACW